MDASRDVDMDSDEENQSPRPRRGRKRRMVPLEESMLDEDEPDEEKVITGCVGLGCVLLFQELQKQPSTASSQSRCGTISKIVLKDFMSHKSIKLEFNPQCNFVVGKNGCKSL